jgi:glycosyltransferase involved in cell wall biosynthesis
MTSIFSSTKEALPITTSKAKFVGHGIKVTRFASVNISRNRDALSIISVGRIVPIKRLEEITQVKMVKTQSKNQKIQVTLLGPQPDLTYLAHLKSLYRELSLELIVVPPVSYESVVSHLTKNNFFFTGTPKSVDKAAIEAAIAGCFILTTNMSALETTGMNEVWNWLGRNPPELVSEQATIISKINESYILKLRKVLQDSAIFRNDVETTIPRIIKILTQTDSN